MKCTDLLTQDHKFILRSLDVLDVIAGKVEKSEQVDTTDIESLLHFLRVFGDAHHQTKEESALFPVLMLTEKGPDFVHFANQLCALLRNHIYKEAHILFEIVEGSLSPEQDEQVAGEFQKSDLAARNRQELLDSVRRLESNYMGKAA